MGRQFKALDARQYLSPAELEWYDTLSNQIEKLKRERQRIWERALERRRAAKRGSNASH